MPHAYFNSTKGLNSTEIVTLGKAAAQQLNMTDSDRVCISITLCHAFGIGSGVGSVFERNAALILPAVGGIKGCGIPSERAEVTLQTLKLTNTTLLLADTHIMKHFPSLEPSAVPQLRGGIVKVGSGNTFLDEKIKLADRDFLTMGKA